jgi:hypothetical protein
VRINRATMGTQRRMTNSDDAIMVGGPRDGEQLTAPDESLVLVELDGLMHRYVRTTANRQVGDRTLMVYNYDGVIRPEVANSGD